MIALLRRQAEHFKLGDVFNCFEAMVDILRRPVYTKQNKDSILPQSLC